MNTCEPLLFLPPCRYTLAYIWSVYAEIFKVMSYLGIRSARRCISYSHTWCCEQTVEVTCPALRLGVSVPNKTYIDLHHDLRAHLLG